MTLEHLDIIFAFVLIITGVSLLITALNQAASALLGLRGTQLRWGIATLLKNIDPELAAHADDIAEQVLHHPLISDSSFSGWENKLLSRWRLANAIRKDELMEILRLLAERLPGQAANASPPAWQSKLKDALGKLDPQAAGNVAQVVAEVQKLFPNDAAKVERLVAPMAAAAAALPGRIDQWFDSRGNTDPPGEWTRRYEDLVPQARAVAAVERLNSLVSNKLVLQLVPSPYPRPIYRDWDPHHRTFWGIVASSVLLSLGAPFWFNVLKNLSNLRPVLAKKTEPDATANPAQDG